MSVTGSSASPAPADPPASGAPGGSRAGRPGAEPGPGRLRRSTDRRKAAPLVKIGMVLFAIGVVAIFADFILFAGGARDLPLWLNLTAMLAVVGLGLGLVGVVLENRGASTAVAARRTAQ